MHLAICIKHIPDPEAAFSMFSIDEQTKKVIPTSGLKHVVSPFDEQAIEAALRIREQHAGTRITVITLGNEASRNALKHGLAMGADDGVLLADAAFEDGDAYTTVLTLTAALKKLGAIDLVLTGRQAADGDAGLVGAGIAERMDVPVISFAKPCARRASPWWCGRRRIWVWMWARSALLARAACVNACLPRRRWCSVSLSRRQRRKNRVCCWRRGCAR